MSEERPMKVSQEEQKILDASHLQPEGQPCLDCRNLITFHRRAWQPDLVTGLALPGTWSPEAPPCPPPSTFSFCCSTLTPSASSASSDMTHQDFLSRCHCFLGPWGKRILAALVLGCINLVFYYQCVEPCVPEPLIFQEFLLFHYNVFPRGE